MIEVGIADIKAGRYMIAATQEDEHLLQERMMAKLRAGLAAGS